MRVAAWPEAPKDALCAALLLAAPHVVAPNALHYISAAAAAAPPGPTPELLALLLAKRLSLYAAATSAVALSALRSTYSPSGLGARLKLVTTDALGSQAAALFDESLFDAPGEANVTASLATSLDSTSGAQQALALPVLLSALLASSVLAPALLSSVSPPDALEGAAAKAALAASLATIVHVGGALSALSTLGVCCTFAATECRSIARAARPDGALSLAASAAAAAGVLVACYAPVAGWEAWAWPLQNGINVCFAVSVARVLQLPRLPIVIAALSGVALYDFTFAGGAASAAVVADASGSGGATLMETVARSRLDGGFGGAWQPGLLVVRLDGRLTDALGLGDVVFPAMLAGWARRFDIARDAPERARPASPYLPAAIAGYALGCILLEFAPYQLSASALVTIAPTMLAAVLGTAVANDELESALSFGSTTEAQE